MKKFYKIFFKILDIAAVIFMFAMAALGLLFVIQNPTEQETMSNVWLIVTLYAAIRLLKK